MLKRSIKTRIFVVLLFLLLMAVGLSNSLLLNNYTVALATQAHQQNDQALKQLSYYCDSYLSEIYNLTLIPYYYESIIDTLRKEVPTTPAERLVKRRFIENFLNSAMMLPRKDVLQVFIISDALYSSSNTERINASYEAIKDADWYKQILISKQLTVLLPGEDNARDDQHFSVVNVIKDLNNHDRILGVIKVDATFHTLKEVCNSIDLGSSGCVSIYAGDERLIYSTLPQGSKALDGSIVSSCELKQFGWKIIAVNSLDDLRILKSKARRIAILISAVIIIFIALLLLYTINKVFHPLNKMIQLMKQVRGGNREIRYKEIRHDEIGYLGETLNDMLDQLNVMMDNKIALEHRISMAQIAERDIKLRLLYGQIRPHFIYNTLNTVNILIQQRKNEQAIELINRFSGLLRGIAYIEKEIPLKTEIKLIEAYLSIQAVRFADTLTYKLEIAEESQSIIVPALILQPIVENSMYYGRNDSEIPLNVIISSVIEGEELLLRVIDNGEGMTDDRLVFIQNRLSLCTELETTPINNISHEHSSEDNGGLGLINVYSRLRAFFGEKCSMIITSELGKGTKVTIRIPAEKRKADKE